MHPLEPPLTCSALALCAAARDNIGNKGYGKTHMLVSDLFGRPIYCEAGLSGNRNDRGLWKTTEIYNNPDEFLVGTESIVLDGGFPGNLHCKTDSAGILPADRPTLNAAAPMERRGLTAYNRKQRHLRTPIEQLNAMIKQYKIVGNIKYRGNIEVQGLNWLLCTQLTARTMRLRDAYPRGRKWLEQAGELEQWEKDMGEFLYVDPQNPDLYRI